MGQDLEQARPPRGRARAPGASLLRPARRSPPRPKTSSPGRSVAQMADELAPRRARRRVRRSRPGAEASAAAIISEGVPVSPTGAASCSEHIVAAPHHVQVVNWSQRVGVPRWPCRSGHAACTLEYGRDARRKAMKGRQAAIVLGAFLGALGTQGLSAGRQRSRGAARRSAVARGGGSADGGLAQRRRCAQSAASRDIRAELGRRRAALRSPGRISSSQLARQPQRPRTGCAGPASPRPAPGRAYYAQSLRRVLRRLLWLATATIPTATRTAVTTTATTGRPGTTRVLRRFGWPYGGFYAGFGYPYYGGGYGAAYSATAYGGGGYGGGGG